MSPRYARVDAARARRLCEGLLRAAGVEEIVARTIVDVQIAADERGMHSHGLRALPMYLDRIRRGIINPRPRVRIERTASFASVVHGDDGPGQYVATLATRECLAHAAACGIGFVVARRSNHLGAVGHYARTIADAGYVGFATTNGNVMLAHPGTVTPFVGNNPLAWAFPSRGEPGLTVDFATSVVAGGRVDLAAAEGESIPEGWALDRTGRTTTDARAAAESGLALPLGAPAAPHKGIGLALALEALAGVLSGARFGRQHAVEVERGERPWDEGHAFMAIDPATVMPRDEFLTRMDALVVDVRTADPSGASRVPGEGAVRQQRESRTLGVRLPVSVLESLNNAAIAAGLPDRLFPGSGDQGP